MELNLFRKHSKKPGEAPGTVVYVGESREGKVSFELINYDENNFSKKIITENEFSTITDLSGIKWINVVGIHNTDILEKIGSHFSIHPLVLEDIANTSQQPKIEDYSELIYTVLKMFYVNSENEIRMEHINFILQKNLLISFQEVPGDVFDPVRKRLEDGRKKLRSSNSDYLFYALVDAIIDNYFIVLRKFGEKMNELKKSITHNASQSDLLVLDKLQEEILVIQNSVEPITKMIPELEDFDSSLIDESNSVYFKDLHDHIIQISSTLDAVKDKLSSMNDYYLSVVSNRTNEVMKTLALVATICVPITVIAGIYGMNFQYMPELSSPISYPIVLVTMAGVGLSLYGYFKKKKWV